MKTAVRLAVVLLAVSGSPGVLSAEVDSRGNTDGILTWWVGSLPPGKSDRQVVLFAFGGSPGEVAGHLAAARIPPPVGLHAPGGSSEPAEPETRDLKPDEAQAVLRRDWLFQADGMPTVERAVQEIQWARQLAARLKQDPKTPDLAGELAELEALERRLAASKAPTNAGSPHPGPLPEGEGAYLTVRAVKRRAGMWHAAARSPRGR